MSLMLVVSMIMLNGAPFADSRIDDLGHEQFDVFEMEEYISTNQYGVFVFDKERASKDGIDKHHIKMQEEHLKRLNALSKLRMVNVHRDLSVEVLVNETDSMVLSNYGYSVMSGDRDKAVFHLPNCGGGRNTYLQYHWWGYSMYACDCETRQLSDKLRGSETVSGGVAAIAVFFNGPVSAVAGLSTLYLKHLADRLSANNWGRGTIVGMTYALIFDIEPQ